MTQAELTSLKAGSSAVVWLKTLSEILAIAVIVLGCSTVLGWMLNLDLLKSILPGFIPLRLSSALCFILMGVSLLQWHHLQKYQGPDEARIITYAIPSALSRVLLRLPLMALPTAVLGISLLRLVGYLFQQDWSLDQIVFSWVLGQSDIPTSQVMPPNSAFSFVVLSLGLVTLMQQRYRLCQWLSGIGFLVGFFGLLGYIYQIHQLYAVGNSSDMAWHAAIGFILLSLGIVCACCDRAWMKVVSSDYAGGIIARRLLPVLPLLPLGLGALNLISYRSGVFDLEMGTALRTVLNVPILSWIVWWNARFLNNIDFKRQQLQQAVHDGEVRFRAVFDQAMQLIGLLTTDGRLMEINQTGLEFLDVSLSHHTGELFWLLPWWVEDGVCGNQDLPRSEEIVRDDLRAAFFQAVSGYAVRLEACVQTGESFATLDLSIKPLKDRDGKVMMLMFEGRDITERKQMELALRQFQGQLQSQVRERTADLAVSESRLQLALDATRTGIWDYNLTTGNMVWVGHTEAVFGLCGDCLEETTYSEFLNYIHPDDREEVDAATQTAIREKKTLDVEYRIPWNDGTIHWISSKGQVLGSPRQSRRVIGLAIDITERKWAEQEVRLFQSISLSIREAPSLSIGLVNGLQEICDTIGWDFAEAWLVDPDTDILKLEAIGYADPPHLQEFVEYSQTITFSRWVGIPGRAWGAKQSEWIEDLAQIDGEHYVRKELAQLAGLKAILAVPLVTDDQVVAVFLLYAETYRRRDEAVLQLVRSLASKLGAAIQRKRAEAELQKSHNLLQAVFASSGDSIFVKDLQGNYLTVNPAAAEMIGKPVSEIVGQNDTAIFASPDLIQQFLAIDRKVLETGVAQTSQEALTKPEGIRYYLTVKNIWRDFQGEAIGLVGISRDISDRVLAEQRINQLNQELELRVQQRTAQLEAANKELEAFSYSVSHDLRAPLRGIDGFSQALLKRYAEGLDEKAQHYLQRIRANTQRMSELIDDMLHLSRVTRSEMHLQAVNLSTIAQEIADQLQATQPDRPVEWVITPDITAVGDSRLLKIVLENLLGNAWKYSAKKAIAHIEFNLCSLAEFISPSSPVGSDDEIAYYIRDNGAGFDMQYVSKLFGAFQRLHDDSEFQGTGVGLATVARIIYRHGGKVGAIGAVDQGATIYFTLPSVEPCESVSHDGKNDSSSG